MNSNKFKKKLISYIKFKELAESIKLVVLSQLSDLKNKISILYNKKYYNTLDSNICLLNSVNVDSIEKSKNMEIIENIFNKC